MEMSKQWAPIDCVVGGTQYFRQYAAVFLPQEPREDEDAWKRRVSHATLSPFTVRIAEQAAGLILRKPIQLTAKEEGQELDSYWEEFAANVDGYGTDLDSYARRLAISSILYGHACTLVDYPSTEPAPNLMAERLMGLRPYFIQVDARDILGWRMAEGSPTAPVSMVRINEYVSEPYGEFGDITVRQVRVLEPGRWRVYRRVQGDERGDQKRWMVVDEGTTSLDVIPLTTTYSQRVAEFISQPPLLPIANLNIAHGQRTADLSHSLHVAALPILVLQGYDDNDDTIGLSANSAILLPIDGSASYVEPASSAFEAQQSYITELENQMSSLGISTLFAQKMGTETAESKRLSRTDSDSLLSIVSKDLESSLQDAFDAAAAFNGMEAPKITLDRDFDTQVLDGPQVDQYSKLWMNGAITHETMLQMLKRGEVLPEIDVEQEVELVDQEKASNMMMQAAAPSAVAAPEPGEGEAPSDDTGDIRSAVEERLRRMVSSDNDDDEDDDN